MIIKCSRSFGASLDDGLTTTVFPAGAHDVPDEIGKMAIKNYGAKNVTKEAEAKAKKEAEE